MNVPSYRNIVYILIFTTLELCLCFDAASSFVTADGRLQLGTDLMTVGGVFAFLSSLLGYYCVLHYMCQDALPFPVPMGDTSRIFRFRRAAVQEDRHDSETEKYRMA